MSIARRDVVRRACAAVLLSLLAASSAALAADDKPYVMKIALATVNDPLVLLSSGENCRE